MGSADGLPIDAIRVAAADARVVESVRTVLGEADRRVEAGGWVCRNRGLCCDFGQWGHRLYVTTGELACFLAGTGPSVAAPDGQRCPYHRDGVCTAREHRPVGCRLFFCDPASEAWQGLQYQQLRPSLMGLHEDFGLAYRYVEWLGALRELAGA